MIFEKASPGPLAASHLNLSIHLSRAELGRAAAERSAEIIRAAIAARGRARLLVATGNSQLDLIEHLTAQPLEWSRVDAFHLDEYVGIAPDHPASFRHWIRTRFEEKVRPGSMHYIRGDAPDPDQEARRYSALLLADAIDLAFVGFGENGHIAFNDPPVADFADPLTVKRVALDPASRAQQVNEGHFPNLAAVPREALSVTCSGLMRAMYWVCSVPEARKAAAVRAALEDPIGPACPATMVRLRPRDRSFIFLDRESAALLPGATVR